MGIKKYTAYTPSRRNMSGSDFAEVTKTTPEKSLIVSKRKHAGKPRLSTNRPPYLCMSSEEKIADVVGCHQNVPKQDIPRNHTLDDDTSPP